MHNRVGTLGNFMSTFGFFLLFSSSCKPFFGRVVLILVVKVVLGSFFWILVAVLWKKTCKLDAFFSLVLSFVDNNDLVADWLVGGLKFGWHNILYSKFRWLFCVITIHLNSKENHLNYAYRAKMGQEQVLKFSEIIQNFDSL